MSVAAPKRVPVAATCVAALVVSGSIHAAGPSPVTLSERTAGGTSYLRYLSSSPSYLAMSEMVIHLGLGTAPVVDELRVEFSRGQVMFMTDLPVNRHMVIVAPKLGDLDQDGVIGITDFLGLLGVWGPVGTTSGLTADLDADGTVGITDLLILLGAWG